MRAPLAYGVQQLQGMALPDDATPEQRQQLRLVFMAGAWLCNRLHLQACGLGIGPAEQGRELLTDLQRELFGFGLEAEAAALLAQAAGGVA